MMRVVEYRPEMQPAWDAFVRSSKNGTFLLARSYMDYHSDRFTDASAVVMDESERWLAIFPASRRDATVSSHGGLTYGGVLCGETMTTPLALSVFEALRRHLVEMGVETVIYKTVPHIYHRLPAEEDRYALFRANAQLIRRDVLSVVEPAKRPPIQTRRKRGIQKATKAGVQARRCTEFGPFWSVLEATLLARHGTKPVHTLAEIEFLASRFPENISCYGAFMDTTLVAGVVMYASDRVAHAQYIASSEQGRDVGALDFLFEHLISEAFSAVPFFDFGISNKEAGRVLNVGLIEQKEGFGARAVVHDHYQWSLNEPIVATIE
jgi:hypothetical protein